MRGTVDRLTTQDFNEFLKLIAQILGQDPPVLVYESGVLPNIKVKLHNPKTNETTKESQLLIPVLEIALGQAISEIFVAAENVNQQAMFIEAMMKFWTRHNLQTLIIPSMFYSAELDLTMYFLMRIPKEIQLQSITDWSQYLKSNVKQRVRTETNSTGFFLRYDAMCYEYAKILTAILLGLAKVHD